MKSTIEKFKSHNVIYNRNGISGRQFYTVYFSYEEDGTFRPNMLAVIPVGDGEDDPNDTETFVIDLNFPDECWRGPHFYADVLSAIKRYNKSKFGDR